MNQAAGVKAPEDLIDSLLVLRAAVVKDHLVAGRGSRGNLMQSKVEPASSSRISADSPENKQTASLNIHTLAAKRFLFL